MKKHIMKVQFKKGEKYIVGKLTGRIINGKYEIKTKQRAYYYTEKYEEVKK